MRRISRLRMLRQEAIWSRMAVSMPMMEVRVVRMAVHQANVPVPMSVWFTGRIAGTMHVLVMLVVTMPMFMLHRFVNVLTIMPFGQMQPEA